MYAHGNIKLTKVDEDYPDNKLTGATFEVYKDVNGDGKLDDADELIGGKFLYIVASERKVGFDNSLAVLGK